MLNVSAVEKSTGKEQQIAITNTSNRLSDADIKRMTADAEKFAKEDEEFKVRVEAKNGLENYRYSMKNAVSDEKLKDKISPEDKKSIEDAVDKTLAWLDNNQLA